MKLPPARGDRKYALVLSKHSRCLPVVGGKRKPSRPVAGQAGGSSHLPSFRPSVTGRFFRPALARDPTGLKAPRRKVGSRTQRGQFLKAKSQHTLPPTPFRQVVHAYDGVDSAHLGDMRSPLPDRSREPVVQANNLLPTMPHDLISHPNLPQSDESCWICYPPPVKNGSTKKAVRRPP